MDGDWQYGCRWTHQGTSIREEQFKERGEREQIREVIIVLVIWKKIQRR
jgi:hypothetical protein